MTFGGTARHCSFVYANPCFHFPVLRRSILLQLCILIFTFFSIGPDFLGVFSGCYTFELALLHFGSLPVFVIEDECGRTEGKGPKKSGEDHALVFFPRPNNTNQ